MAELKSLKQYLSDRLATLKRRQEARAQELRAKAQSQKTWAPLKRIAPGRRISSPRKARFGPSFPRWTTGT